MQQLHTIFLISVLTLWQGSSVQSAWSYVSPTAAPAVVMNYTTVSVELDPDVFSVTGNCTAGFAANLTAQLSIWFTDGIASQTQSYPQLANPSGFFKNTVFQGRRNYGNRALLMGDDKGDEQQHQNRDLACTQNPNCDTCCPAYCMRMCGGKCNLCQDGRTRNLRGARELEDDRWWAAVEDDDAKQNVLADSIKFAAQRWLYRFDQTRCMGNPWKLIVQLSYF